MIKLIKYLIKIFTVLNILLLILFTLFIAIFLNYFFRYFSSSSLLFLFLLKFCIFLLFLIYFFIQLFLKFKFDYVCLIKKLKKYILFSIYRRVGHQQGQIQELGRRNGLHLCRTCWLLRKIIKKQQTIIRTMILSTKYIYIYSFIFMFNLRKYQQKRRNIEKFYFFLSFLL